MIYFLHVFGPGETIDGIIRLLGRHNYVKSEMEKLRKEFTRVNGFIVPKMGQLYKVPVLDDY